MNSRILVICLYIFSFDAFAFIDIIPPLKDFPDTTRTSFMKKSFGLQTVGVGIVGAGLLYTEGKLNSEKRTASGVALGTSFLFSLYGRVKFKPYYKNITNDKFYKVIPEMDNPNSKELAIEEEKMIRNVFYTGMIVNGGLGIYLASKSDNDLNKIYFYTLPISSLVLSTINQFFIEKYSVKIGWSPVFNDGSVAGNRISFAYNF